MSEIPPTYWTDQIRAQLAATRSGFCSHGVAPERCAEHRASNEPTAEETG